MARSIKNLVKNASEGIQLATVATYVGLVVKGELMQASLARGEEVYNWMTGHLSDIGAAGASTSLLLTAANSMRSKLSAAIAVPLTYTMLELVPLVWEGAATRYDPQDILCYFGASALSLGVKESSDRFFREKGLEGTINS